MKCMVLLLICIALMPLGAQAGKLYRWVDANGKVHYGDAPPPDAIQIETKKLSDAAAPNQDMPYETRLAQQNFPVTLYVADNCVDACNQARNLLVKRGIPFSEKSLKTQEEIDALKKLSGSDGLPTLAVGKNYLKGFQEKQWHSELDIAGYPKTSTYRAPAVPAAASQPAPAQPAAR
ncbi:MAG: glutaredoxin family protein [Gallionella sp.]|nr:MAG: glutaredoxin family protein [Gallionella sp.]